MSVGLRGFFFVSEKIREKREELMCAAVGGTIRKGGL